MRVLLNHQVIWTLNDIIATLFHNINYTGVLRWIGLMLLEIYKSENGSKYGQFWPKTDHENVDRDIS